MNVTAHNYNGYQFSMQCPRAKRSIVYLNPL